MDVAMIPASGDEADEIRVLTQRVEEMKRKGWTVVGEKAVTPKPKPKKESE